MRLKPPSAGDILAAGDDAASLSATTNPFSRRLSARARHLRLQAVSAAPEPARKRSPIGEEPAMHEMALVHQVVSLVLDQVRDTDVTEVTAVHLTIGEGRDVIEDYMGGLFSFVARGTVAEHAKLVIHRVPLHGALQPVRRSVPHQRARRCHLGLPPVRCCERLPAFLGHGVHGRQHPREPPSRSALGLAPPQCFGPSPRRTSHLQVGAIAALM